MKNFSKIVFLALILSSAISTRAGNFSIINGSNIQDATGTNKLSTGQICFLGVNQNNQPIAYQAGGGGQVISRPVCTGVTGGVVGTLQVADSTQTNPANVYYRIIITDSNTGQIVYQVPNIVQPCPATISGSPFNLDSFAPGCGAPLPATGGTVTGPLAINGNVTITGNATISGTCTGCSPSSLFYQTVQENGVSQTQRSTVNYNNGVVATDVGGKTEIDLASQIFGSEVSVPDVQAVALGVSQANAGALAATTYYIQVVCTFPWSGGLPGTEQTFVASPSNVITITSPTLAQCGGGNQATSYSVYLGNTATGGSGTETLQASGISIGTNWTEPSSGLVAGAALPTTYTFDANYGNVQRLTLTENVTGTTLVNAKAGSLMTFIVGQNATGGWTFTWPTNFQNWAPDINPFAGLFTTITGVAAGDAGSFGRPQQSFAEHVIPFSGSPQINPILGTVQRIVLTGDISVGIGFYWPGGHYSFVACQDGAGGHNITWPATFVNPPVIHQAPNACTVIDFVVDTPTQGTTGNVKFRVLNNRGGVSTVSFSATPTFDASLGRLQKITLTGNVTSSTLNNGIAGQEIAFDICQDGTGGRTFVWPGNAKGTMTIGATASKCSAQTFSFDGTNWYATSQGVTNQ